MAGCRPAFSTAASALPTMSRAAATSRTRTMRPPDSLVNSSSGWKSRIACSTGIGMKSCTWKARLLRSSLVGSHGRSTWRTTTFWFATPTTTFLLLNFACAQSCLMAAATASLSTTSPSRTAPAGRATCPKRSRVVPDLPDVSSAARTPDVPMSSPTTGLPATARSPQARCSLFVRGAIGRPEQVLEGDGA